MNTRDDDDINAQVDAMLAAQRAYKRRWAVYGLVVLLVGVGLIATFAWFREFFFRPTPDLAEVEKNVFDLTNDPACRELLTNVDTLQLQWTKERDALRSLYDADPDAIQAGRKQIRTYLDAYRIESRRVTIIKGQWRHVQRDIESFLGHIIFYLDKMDGALEQRVLALAAAHHNAAPDAGPSPDAAPAPDAAPDAGAASDAGQRDPIAEAVAKKSQGDPKAEYERFWSHVTEDHDKWRIYRQGPIPCGKREGAVPPLPDTANDAPLDLGAPTEAPKGTSTIRVEP